MKFLEESKIQKEAKEKNFLRLIIMNERLNFGSYN